MLHAQATYPDNSEIGTDRDNSRYRKGQSKVLGSEELYGTSSEKQFGIGFDI